MLLSGVVLRGYFSSIAYLRWDLSLGFGLLLLLLGSLLSLGFCKGPICRSLINHFDILG